MSSLDFSDEQLDRLVRLAHRYEDECWQKVPRVGAWAEWNTLPAVQRWREAQELAAQLKAAERERTGERTLEMAQRTVYQSLVFGAADRHARNQNAVERELTAILTPPVEGAA